MVPLPSRELVERHSRPGPRYTSYPPATAWSVLDPSALDERLARADSTGGPLSLYVHLPFCPEMCRFCGCNVIATRDRSRADAYLDVLEREVALWASRLPRRRTFSSLHLGGGTPTFLSPSQLERLWTILTRHFTPTNEAELALEVDPAITTPEHLALLGELGFRRLSVGVQDLDPQVQAAINRIQTAEETTAIIDAARASGFTSVNVDLLYGLPFQTPATMRATLLRVLRMGPDRLALFGYAHVPWRKPNQRLLPTAHLPGPFERVELFVSAVRLLEEMGYRQIGLDHFARADDALARAQEEGTLGRNFQGYSADADTDTLALGVSGISDLGGAFLQNAHRLGEWEAAIDAGRLPVERGLSRSDDDELRGAAIRNILCLLALDVRDLHATFGDSADRLWTETRPSLEPLAADGLVALSPHGLRVTPLGRLFLRNVAMPFDHYLPPEDTVGTFSQTV